MTPTARCRTVYLRRRGRHPEMSSSGLSVFTPGDPGQCSWKLALGADDPAARRSLRVQIRSALPAIITGMRISMAGAWTSIVAAELIAAMSGLGYLISQARDYLNTALLFSGIIAIAIVGLTLDARLRGLLLLADPSRRPLQCAIRHGPVRKNLLHPERTVASAAEQSGSGSRACRAARACPFLA